MAFPEAIAASVTAEEAEVFSVVESVAVVDASAARGRASFA